jgi:hypothetical protein
MEAVTVEPYERDANVVAFGSKDTYNGTVFVKASGNSIILVRINYRVLFRFISKFTVNSSAPLAFLLLAH